MSDLVKIPDLREQAEKLASSMYQPHRFGDQAAWFDACVRLAMQYIERIAQHDAEIERLRKALRNMVIMTGKPHREEWLNPQAFADALKIFEEAREALERTDQQLQPRENRDEIWRNS
jgi:hypothetical protein